MAEHTGSTGPPIRANTMEPEVYRQALNIMMQGRVGVLGSGDYLVTQTGSPSMGVLVAAGFAMVPGTNNPPVEGSYNTYNDAATTVALAASNGSNPRIDLIVLTVPDAYYSGASNTAILQAITGVAAPSPAVPATPANSLVLAHVYVGTAVASVTNANINVTTGAGNPDTIAFTPGRCTGLQAFAVNTGGTVTATASPGTLIPGLTVTVNVPAGRNIRVRFTIPFAISAATVVVTTQVSRDGSGTLLPGTNARYSNVNSGYTDTLTGEVIDQPAAGLHTYGVYAYSGSADTLTYVAGQGSLTAEDMGPV